MGTQLERAVELLRESDDLMMYFGGSELIYRDASILRFRRLYFLLSRELDGGISNNERFKMMLDDSCDLLPRFVHVCSVHLIEEAEHFLEKFHQNQQTNGQI